LSNNLLSLQQFLYFTHSFQANSRYVLKRTTRIASSLFYALLGYYTAPSGNTLPTFRDNLSVPSSRVKKSLNIGGIGCPETSVKDCHSMLRNVPEECRCHRHRSGNLKSREGCSAYLLVVYLRHTSIVHPGFILRLFALTRIASSQQFLICALSFSV
jgi:hypothetical protein